MLVFWPLPPFCDKFNQLVGEFVSDKANTSYLQRIQEWSVDMYIDTSWINQIDSIYVLMGFYLCQGLGPIRGLTACQKSFWILVLAEKPRYKAGAKEYSHHVSANWTKLCIRHSDILRPSENQKQLLSNPLWRIDVRAIVGSL